MAEIKKEDDKRAIVHMNWVYSNASKAFDLESEQVEDLTKKLYDVTQAHKREKFRADDLDAKIFKMDDNHRTEKKGYEDYQKELFDRIAQL